VQILRLGWAMLEARRLDGTEIFDHLSAPWVRQSWHAKIVRVPAPPTCRIFGRPWPVGGDCCLWTGANDGKPNGRVHGKVKIGKRRVYLHRYAFAQHHGVEIDGLDNIDHICRNSTCFNPYHLEDVNGLTNTERGDGVMTQFSEFYQPKHNEDHKGLTAEDIAALAGEWKEYK